jgi:alkylation response protein AidB-like acyl-CoA dehydrogenase
MPSAIAEAADLNDLDDHGFRMRVRGWIEANYPPEIRNPPKRLHFPQTKQWYFKLAAQGWLCPGWPRQYGGMGLTAGKQLVMIEEFQRHGCARFNDMGVSMIGPLLIRFGTDAQKQHFLPKILTGEHIWCQGYSEPNAGSDLASLRTEAIPDGDHWVVNGQKIWTSLAMDANWIFLLVRTNKSAKRQEGISFLLVPMDSAGITIRPIRNIDMGEEFCEVFFDNVRVPLGNLVGEIDRGWTMAKALLSFERIGIGSPRQSTYAMAKLKILAEHAGAWDDEVVRERYDRLAVDLRDHAALYETFAERVRSGTPLGQDVSMLKVHQTELYQRITDLMLEVGGEEAALLDPIGGNRDLNPAGQFLQARPSTIYGGSNEIQRNILAKNVLGLPS